MGSFSLWHWLIVLLVVVLIFGTKRLRNIGGDLGAAARDFKNAARGESPPEASAPPALEAPPPAAPPASSTTSPSAQEPLDPRPKP